MKLFYLILGIAVGIVADAMCHKEDNRLKTDNEMLGQQVEYLGSVLDDYKNHVINSEKVIDLLFEHYPETWINYSDSAIIQNYLTSYSLIYENQFQD